MTCGIKGTVWLILLTLAAAAAAFILLRGKRKKAEKKTAPAPQADRRPEEDSRTIGLWDDGAACRITLTDVHFPERCFQASIDTSLVIGYARESDICLDYDKTVSRRHCEIVREGPDLYLINHSRSNGTLLNGYQITARTPLSSGSIIKMGRVEMRVAVSF